ncbi:MAG: GNAT family N-acetyltransferase [Ginsengibacter sp.]
MNFSFDVDIVLENSVALLRPLQTSDIENLLDIATSDKTLLQFSPAPIYTKELLENYVDKAIENGQNKTHYSFSIFDKTKNVYAGSTSFLNISEFENRLEIGSTWVGKKF